ncbi:TolC family protein [Macellibacteroides fermentans]|uniref:TolC family protein n=1 Tax=Macellibacteroides fermentans TaxID=879969 RepID=UPI003B94E3E6
MKLFVFTTIFFVLSILHGNELQAQTNNDSSEFNLEDYKKISLPPLDSLFENAKNSPIFELSNIKEQIEIHNLRKEKKAWLNYFSIRGSYQYGMFGNESTYSDIYTPIYFNYSTAAQNSYSVGAGISIPLDHLFDLRGRVKRQKLLVKSASIEKDIRFDEIKKEIIILYSNTLFQLQVLKLKSESLLMTQTQYSISEKDFTNGLIDYNILTQEKQKLNNSIEQFENTKAELMKNLLLLESISNTSILSK